MKRQECALFKDLQGNQPMCLGEQEGGGERNTGPSEEMRGKRESTLGPCEA